MQPAILFDLDGTLVDHETTARTAIVAWASEQASRHRQTDQALGDRWLTLEEEHFVHYLAGSTTFQEQRRERVRGILQCLGQAGHRDPALDVMFSAYIRHYEASWRSHNDVLPALTKLRQAGAVLGVLTNGQEAQQRAKLAAVHLLEAFDCIIASSTLSAAKPAQDAVVEACRRLGRAPNDVVYVVDRLHSDALAASDAGGRGIWLNRKGIEADVTSCDSVNSLHELPDLLLDAQ